MQSAGWLRILLPVVLAVGGCAATGGVMQREGCHDVSAAAAASSEASWRNELAQLRSGYVSNLQRLFGSAEIPLQVKREVAVALGREGERNALEWLGHGFRTSDRFETFVWAKSIDGLLPDQMLIRNLLASQNPDCSTVAAYVLAVDPNASGETLRAALGLLDRERDNEFLRLLGLLALARNSPWRENLAAIGHQAYLEGRRGESGRRALAALVSENGEMTVGQFRKYVRAFHAYS